MDFKRITLLAGHYGSGKTNIAVNIAYLEKTMGFDVSVADLDIVNPYFRTKDSANDFEEWGIKLIASPFANSNVDLPALPQELYSIIDDKSRHCVVDVGGDDRGAFALGRYTPGILQENNYEMIFVINCYRPLTRDVESTIGIMREIETAGGLKFTSIVNNSNLGEETNAETVLNSVKYAEKVSRISGLPIKFTSVSSWVYDDLFGKIDNLLKLELQRKLF